MTRTKPAPVDHAAALAERVATERADQGLPPTVEDPEVLARLGRIFARAEPPRTARRPRTAAS